MTSPIPEPDLIARGMSWDDTKAMIKEVLTQAGYEGEPDDRAINILQRMANTAHKAGFKQALERVAVSLPTAEQSRTALVDDSCDHGCNRRNGCDDCPDYVPSPHAPVEMILFCPKCGVQHIDKDNSDEIRIEAAERGIDREGERECERWIEEREWTNPPHRSHLCHACKHIWRPADVPTNGVAEIKTKGSADSHVVVPAVAVQAEPVAWESTTVCYTQFVTQSRYEKFSEKVQRWYKPYRCSACAAHPKPAAHEGEREALQLRALRMADMQLAAWENGYAFDSHGPSREAQRLVTEALAQSPQPPIKAVQEVSDAQIWAVWDGDRGMVSPLKFARAILALRSGASTQPAEGGAKP